MSEEKQFEPPHEEFVRRIFYSMVSAALELAADEEMSLAETIHWIETAYFHLLRERGLKMREISTHLDVSMRKTAKLADQLKQNFFDPDREHTLPRRIEFMLWSEPLSRSRLLQVMKVDTDELDHALELLVEQERVYLESGRSPRYCIASTTRRIVGRTWMGRIDGLNHLMTNVYHTIKGRFFQEDPNAFARTVQLRVRPEDLPQLRRIYEEIIWPELQKLDELASGTNNPVPLDLSILWASAFDGDRDV